MFNVCFQHRHNELDLDQAERKAQNCPEGQLKALMHLTSRHVVLMQGADVTKGDREDVLRANRTQTANLVPPIRQTASIFKQPVTVFKVGSVMPAGRPAHLPQPGARVQGEE